MDEIWRRQFRFHATTAVYIAAAVGFFLWAQRRLRYGPFGLGYIEATIYASIVLAMLWRNKRVTIPAITSAWLDRAVVYALPLAAFALAIYLASGHR